ncbi:CPBP family intramembrane glutamic endopeptidase [Alicyclobacillus sp. SP_1]|jgi:membrane protease YdiL (CAAX protease family)|uniref:CPBP family intramembrane glutamic endopeptidase n=1 Tax=Alicyclobacillus sp. SP_1 TaxID=2942475 RepID=UPI002157FEB1|nr:CPBP family intramembrane glutamic endopeptidase [Alicyclobacillus sp. SP_1]
MSIQKRGWNSLLLVTGFLIYVGVTLWLYHGPLHTILLPSGMTDIGVLWNYAAFVILVAVLFLFRNLTPNREIPQLRATWQNFGTLFGSIVLLFGVGYVVWFHMVSYTESLMQSKIFPMLPLAANAKFINALLGIVVTAIFVSIAVWKLKGWRRQSFSLSWATGLLTLVLVLACTILAIVRNHVFLVKSLVAPNGNLVETLVIFVSQFFINGLMEETYFRGYMFPQLLTWVRHPVLAAWIMIVVFDAAHIPQGIVAYHDVFSWWQWLLYCMFPLQPTGWLYWAIYYRTGSVLPGALFHTYITNWAFMFTL